MRQSIVIEIDTEFYKKVITMAKFFREGIEVEGIRYNYVGENCVRNSYCETICSDGGNIYFYSFCLFPSSSDFVVIYRVNKSFHFGLRTKEGKYISVVTDIDKLEKGCYKLRIINFGEEEVCIR